MDTWHAFKNIAEVFSETDLLFLIVAFNVWNHEQRS